MQGASLTMNRVIDSYIDGQDWRVHENSNQQYSLQGLNNHITGKAIAEYWLSEVYPKDISDAHRSGSMHIHDLSSLSPYCIGWDLLDLLMVGFTGVKSKLTSKPAKHFRVALMQAVNFMYTIQGEAAGAIAFSNFDTLLAPFIYYDKLSPSEVRQALQEFVFNMNVPTRTGFQSVFSNITLDLIVPNTLKQNPVIIGGKPQDKTYGDMQPFLDIFNKALAEVFIEGDATGVPFTFPIPTYNLTNDFDWSNPVLEPIWEMTAKYGIPTFANFIGSDMNPDDVRSMCCRLRLDNRELQSRGGGLFGSAPLTGSIGVVTINLPRIGYHSKGDKDLFFSELSSMMDLAKRSLIIKRGLLEELTTNNLYPYSSFYLRRIKEETGSYWSNHFSTIGIIGMSDAILNMFNTSIASPRGKAFAEEVLLFMRDKLSGYQLETGEELWNLEATPAEGTSFRLAKIDQETYPDMRMHCLEDYDSDSAYYTNSTHLPVGYIDDSFFALAHQEGLQSLYTGGSVFHAFLGDPIPTWDGAKCMVKAIATGFKIPYFTLTPTFSICSAHGYIAGEVYICPECGRKADVFSRVVGYIRPLSSWNDGKKAEFQDRKEYKAISSLSLLD